MCTLHLCSGHQRSLGSGYVKYSEIHKIITYHVRILHFFLRRYEFIHYKYIICEKPED